MTEDEMRIEFERREMESAEDASVLLGAMILACVALSAFGLGWVARMVVGS